MKLSNQPPKGTADWLPEELKIRQYIFNVWRRVCQSYGYEEYLTPLVESADLYRAKSGEEVGGKELVTFTDLGGRELSIRPEMTPSVTRLVSQIYQSASKPIRFFSIANFMRNEKPQRGRNREFWQLNCDIFGAEGLGADLEILQLALDIMLAFKAPAQAFSLGLSHRQLLNAVLQAVAADLTPDGKVRVARILDKWEKLSRTELERALAEAGLSRPAYHNLLAFLQMRNVDEVLNLWPEMSKLPAIAELRTVMSRLEATGYGDYVTFKPGIIRGFDYYDGLVFEIFDNHKDNRRAIFGGGRYNGLGALFGGQSFPAVGFAPGDETTKLFLESWHLLDEILAERPIAFYLPILSDELLEPTERLARKLRAQGKQIVIGLETQKISKALDYANKKNIAKMIILGSAEMIAGKYKIKDMATGQEEERPLGFKSHGT